MPSIGENTPEKKHQKIEFYLSKFPTRDHDKDSGANILCSRSPSSAKKIGATVKNFKVKEWDRVKKDIMLQLLKAKFTPGSDLAKKLVATSSKSLAEAGQCPTFSIDMTLSNKELFNINKWTKNVLGQLLMKVRDDLKQSLTIHCL